MLNDDLCSFFLVPTREGAKWVAQVGGWRQLRVKNVGRRGIVLSKFVYKLSNLKHWKVGELKSHASNERERELCLHPCNYALDHPHQHWHGGFWPTLCTLPYYLLVKGKTMSRASPTTVTLRRLRTITIVGCTPNPSLHLPSSFSLLSPTSRSLQPWPHWLLTDASPTTRRSPSGRHVRLPSAVVCISLPVLASCPLHALYRASLPMPRPRPPPPHAGRGPALTPLSPEKKLLCRCLKFWFQCSTFYASDFNNLFVLSTFEPYNVDLSYENVES